MMRSYKLLPLSVKYLRSGSSLLSNSFKLLIATNSFHKYSLNETRYFSTNNNKDIKDTKDVNKETNTITKYDHDEYDDYEYEEPKTVGHKIKLYSSLIARLALMGLGVICIFFTARELFPGRMNPNSLFSEVFECIRYNEQVIFMTGEGLKAYGREVGRNSEGRRNHVESYTYTAADKSNRMRIKFYAEGKKGKVLVWAEVSDRMASNEYVYIICQNMRTGKVVTVRDNRDQLESEMLNNLDSNSSTSTLLSNLSLFKKQ